MLAAAAVVGISFVDRRLCRSWRIWPAFVDVDGGKCLVIKEDVRPGHLRKKLLSMALMNVSGVGEKTAP